MFSLKKIIAEIVWQCSKNSFLVRRMLKPLGLHTNYKFYSGKNGGIALWQNKTIFLTNLDKNYLSFELFWKGWEYYEPQTAILINELLYDKDHFLDIGANIGYFSLTAAAHFPEINIISFEPNPKLQTILQENIKKNAFKIFPNSYALSDKISNQTFYIPESDMSGTLEATFNKKINKTITVPTLTLDEFIFQQNLEGNFLFKIDTEGHESAVLSGGGKTLEIHRPDIILEVGRNFKKETANQLKAIGYNFYQIGSNSLNRKDTLSFSKEENFLFLNFLITDKSQEKIANLSKKVYSKCRNINLKETSLYRPNLRLEGAP